MHFATNKALKSFNSFYETFFDVADVCYLMQSHPALIASSSQSRADVATIVIAAVLGLTGLQWVSLKPKIPVTVDLEGELVHFMADTVQQTRIQTEITRYVYSIA